MINKKQYGAQRQLCLHCMRSVLDGGRCRVCGKPNMDENRPPNVLPFGYRLFTPQRRCYLIGDILGIGGFGITYHAWDVQYRRPVALKELYPNRLSRNLTTMEVIVDPEQQSMFQYFKQRFVDEARVISFLRNEPEIINIFDYFIANGTGYYAMEFLDGMDLQHWLEKKGSPFAWTELESAVLQILQGLKVLHGYGLLHRDISPDNIFLCNNGKVKLIDFGSVRSVNANHFTTILKRNFAPQELFLEKGNQGFWTDTYSLCATLYYLLSGHFPIQVYDRIPKIKEKGEDPLPPIEQFQPAAPAYVCAAIMHGLCLDDAKRFRSTDEMKAALFPGTVVTHTARYSLLICVGGLYTGKSYPIQMGTYVSLGRGGSNSIAFPPDYRHVSRRHCVFYAHKNGRLYVQDQESSNGTYLGRRRIEPMKWYEVRSGEYVMAGREVFQWKSSQTNGGAQ